MQDIKDWHAKLTPDNIQEFENLVTTFQEDLFEHFAEEERVIPGVMREFVKEEG
eukprot:CAMPEP_0116889848 /NCGR_PEP_ID=MMETSP0467-20121206/406_1 /TAXON_ID=283647 /ORGANISM="Mesodinium pulex, Strain SPMC105" /LENGTH=53 /DNA_ID=CAMNT_0004557057 /DNA_START=344 /DNA_END=505 /DNA_ORIENTATION=-